MKAIMIILTAFVFTACGDNTGNSSEVQDTVSTDAGYETMTDTVGSNTMNDTTAYGNADSARR